MTETKADAPDFSKISDENIKNYNKEEQRSENKKWVRKLIYIYFA